ncbi:MAG: RagB/SusD family nutrient uptake outer membrane protein [Adhaeribacter sp.]
MKKIALIFLLTGWCCFSCKDFLDEEPRDELSAEQDFGEPAHAFNAVNSLYRNGAPQLFDGAVYSGSEAMIGQYMTGLFDNEYKGQEVHVQHTQQLTLNGQNLSGYLGGIWDDLYRGIARANNAIKYIPATPGLTEAESRQLGAEARFFRALGYYYLVRLFGGVPVITEPYEALENLYVARGSVQEVYALIESDLKYAVEEGGLAQTSMANNGNRITRGAAATLLAEVYLTMSGFPLQENRYADAAAMAKTVIASGVYSLTPHDRNAAGNVVLENSAYNKLRRADVSPNEDIFFHEYTAGIASSAYPQFTYPVAKPQGVAYTLTNGAYQPQPQFLWGYDAANDLRAQEKQFFHTTYNRGGESRTFPPTPYMWHDDEALFNSANSGKDKAVYRYSDVLLIAAEALARSQGVTPEAAGYLAEVRSRAYWTTSPLLIQTQLLGLSVQEFVEEVWEERYRELVFEFQTWYDIVRTRKFPLTSPAANGEITFVDVIGHTNTWGKTFAEKHLLLPISEAERQRNPQLGPQNPGY